MVTLAILALFALSLSSVSGLYDTMRPWINYRNDQVRSGYQPVATPDSNSTLWGWTAGSGNMRNLVVDNGIVYAHSYDDLYALDETTGAQLWTVDVNGGQAAYIGDRALTFSDGKIFVGDMDGYLWCLNATNGQEIWHWPLAIPPGSINTNPVVANGKVYFGTADGAAGNNYLVALNITTGERVWWYTAPDNSILSSPVVDGTWIFFGCDDNKVYALNDTGPFATLIWSKAYGGRMRSTPCVYEDKLFFGSSSTDRSVFAVNKTTGASIWNFTLTSGYYIENSVAVANDIVYFASPSRYLYALNASAPSGAYGESSMEIILWRSLQLPYGTYRSPVITNDKVFVTINNVLFAFDIANGLQEWSYDFVNYVYDDEPVIADGRVFVARYRFVYCFGDFYPANTYQYPVVGSGYEYSVEIVANATCQTFDYSALEAEMRLTYNLEANWIGNHLVMSNITIPHEMLGGPYVLTVDGGGPSSMESVSNDTHTTLSFTYLHQSQDNHDIEIVGTTAIPDFSLLTLLPLLATITIAAIALLKRKILTS
jgi:outer membrane protein assembly factor BamB